MNSRDVLSVSGREEANEQPLNSQTLEHATDTHEHAPIIEWVFIVGKDLETIREHKIQNGDNS